MENGAINDHFGPSASGGKLNRHPGRDVHKPISKCLHDVLKIEKNIKEKHVECPLRTQSPIGGEPNRHGCPRHRDCQFTLVFNVSSASLETALRVSSSAHL